MKRVSAMFEMTAVMIDSA